MLSSMEKVRRASASSMRAEREADMYEGPVAHGDAFLAQESYIDPAPGPPHVDNGVAGVVDGQFQDQAGDTEAHNATVNPTR